MSRTTIIFLILLGILVAVFGWVHIFNRQPAAVNSPLNATYVIDGQIVTLKNGRAESSAVPGSVSKIVTQHFGNAVTHDFDNDGRPDTAFILSQTSGGSGVFYYLVAALNTPEGCVGSQGLFLGDRIAPQSTEMGKGNIIVVNYADRKPGESFVIQPSVGKSLWLLLDPKTMQFGEVVQNFEGEADPAKMTLSMKTWNWINTTYNNSSTTAPRVQNKFVLTFKSPNIFSAATDCNGVGGEYTTNGNVIVLEKMMSTLMFCEGSQEGDFSKALGEVQSYHFTPKGELVFDLKFDSGTMLFR